MTDGSSNYRDVYLFHEKFGLVPEGPPALPSLELQEFRGNFMKEELLEFLMACDDADLPGAADALVDLVYVAMGTAILMGLPWQDLWNEVQRKNMEKMRASDATRSKRHSALDVIKPEGWTPPDHTEALKRYGWKP